MLARPAASRCVSCAPSMRPMVVAAPLQDRPYPADGLGVTPQAIRLPPAQEGALARAESLCASLALEIPNSALLIVDAALRVRCTAGPRWERADRPAQEL